MWPPEPPEKVEHLDVDPGGRADGDAVLWDGTQHVYGPPGGERGGWTLVESAHQESFDAVTDAGAILAVYRWGVASGVPYFDADGVTSGEEAALWLDDNNQYVLVELDL